MCALPSGAALSSTCGRVRHIVTGTFNSDALYLLSYDGASGSLSIESRVAGEGPHQFLALGRTASGRSTLYATSWGTRTLSAWRLPTLEHINTVPITATSSYVHVQPPPYLSLTAPAYGGQPGPARFLYSAGGPTGEMHPLHPETGAILPRAQEYIFLPGGEHALPAADKSRAALRYGSHSIDVTADGATAYVADLGRDAVLAYHRDSATGRLSVAHQQPALVPGDGPRHVVPHPVSEDIYYSVTEHTSFVDVWRGSTHLARLDILPPGAERHAYRGDTVRLSPRGDALFASTRGKTPATRGIVAAWELDADGIPLPLEQGEAMPVPVRYTTRNSGGKANAIEWAPYPAGEVQTLVLTDDEDGWIDVLEWHPQTRSIRHMAETQLPNGEGASHAVWID